MKTGGLVYSTNSELDIEQANTKENQYKKEDFIISVCFEKKGRKGNGATIIKGFLGSNSELSFLAKKIKTSLGTGGSIKNGDIILQGRIQDQVIEILQKNGYKSKKVGG